MIYAQGNEEDLGSIYQNILILSNLLENVAIIAIEYPGYGIYRGFGKCTESRLVKTLETTYVYVRNELNIPKENIIICGRSIGTYPAACTAKFFEPLALILISPFAAIEHVASKFIGKYFADKILGRRFSTMDAIKDLRIPFLIIHGEKDELIPYKHALFLFENAKNVTASRKFLHISKEMTHNKFDIVKDLCSPILKFLSSISPNAQDLNISLDFPQGNKRND
jgi:pimeloyl-ACP methyl ester carboxylesterase